MENFYPEILQRLPILPVGPIQQRVVIIVIVVLAKIYSSSLNMGVDTRQAIMDPVIRIIQAMLLG